MKRAGLEVLLALAGPLCGFLACTPPYARLQGVMVQDRPAKAAELGKVEIVRSNSPRATETGMGISAGDRLITDSGVTAVLVLRGGYEVIVEPGSRLTIENPSIMVRFGKLIVKAIGVIKEKLTVNNEFASAGVEGTVFTYELTREAILRISVLEGSVHVKPSEYEITYGAGEGGTITPFRPPQRMLPLAADTAAVRRRIQVVERAVRP